MRANAPSKPAPRVRGSRQQVAALCWRRAPDLQVLLVTTLRTHRWILPKGWPEPGLSLADSAAKEAREEAGVVGAVGAEPVGFYHYLKEKAGSALPCKVEVFALELLSQRANWPEKDSRDYAWLPPQQAAARVAEPGLRQVILRFGQRMA